MNALRPISSVVLTTLLASPGFSQVPDAQTAAPQRYHLAVVQNASSAKRVKKNRVSAEMVVEVTDQNNVPVAGIAVSFTIPQLVGGGASFSNGGLMSVATTNASGQASSGSFETGGNSSFDMSVVASVPGGAITLSVPISGAAALAAAGGAAGGGVLGLSTGAFVGILGGLAAVGIVVAKVAISNKSSNSGSASTPPTSIGLGGATVGH